MKYFDLQQFATPVKVLARDWKLSLYITSAYVEVKGLTSFEFTAEKNDADTTSFEDDGWQTHLTASRGRGLSAEGFFLEASDKSRDAGQAGVETLAESMGSAALGVWKLETPNSDATYFYGSVNVTKTGGAKDDPTGWGFEIKVSGPTTATDPHGA